MIRRTFGSKWSSATALVVAFVVAHKLLPFLYPRGSFVGSTAGEWLRWVFGFQPTLFELLFAALLLVVSGFPLARFHWRISVCFGITMAVGIGITFFPYNFFDLGVWPSRYESVICPVLVGIICTPWAALALRHYRESARPQ